MASTFSLSSLFLVTTLAAIAAGMFAAAPALGVLFLIVALPALLRTIAVTARRSIQGKASTSGEKIVTFLASMGVLLLLIIMALWSTFAAAATLSPAGEVPTIAGGTAGAVFGIALSGWVLWRLWRRGTADQRSIAATARNDDGALYFARGDTDHALELFAESIQLDPQLAAAHANRAHVHYSRGEWPAALAAIDSAIKLQPNRASFYSDRGRILLDAGYLDEALLDLNAAISLDKRLAEAYNNRGMLHLKNGALAAAIEDCAAAIRLDSADLPLYCNRAQALCEMGDYAAAIDDYDEAIRLQPKSAAVFYQRGVVHRRLGNVRRAIEDLDRALNLEPSLTMAYAVRGLSLHEAGGGDLALANLDQAIQMDPACAIAYNNRGFVKANQGDNPGAIADYEEAIRLAPTYPNAHKNLAWLLATCVDSRYRDGAKALTHAQQALTFSGRTQPQWLEIFAAAFAECGDFEAAVAWQTKAIETSVAPATSEMSTRLAIYTRREALRV